MKNVLIARLEAYENEPIMIIAPEEILNDFLTWLFDAIAEAQIKTKSKEQQKHYQKFLEQIVDNLNTKED